MRKAYLLFALLLSAVLCHAQQHPSIAVEKKVWEDSSDLDAKVYFGKYDLNDRLCALIKVTLIGQFKNSLTLEVGGLGVVAREEKEGGEVWFYVPAQVKNLSFKCAGYEPLDPMPVVFKEGTVYRLSLKSNTSIEEIRIDDLMTNYLKIGVNEAGATISIGRTKEYELLSQGFEGELFATMLDLGEYFYKIEHPFYETYYGSVVLEATTPQQNIQLTPAYGYVNITSSPSGAAVYVNNQYVGTTPCKLERRLAKGNIDLRIEQNDYHSDKSTVRITGDGSRQTIHKTLKPRFATITLRCPDPEAEIWVDNKKMGKGEWSGRLSSISSHHIETRRASHHSQATNISVVDGVDTTHNLNAPIPLYGNLNLTTSPMGCEVTIDGKVVGTTPYLAKLLIGSHEVGLSKDGYLRISFPVEIAQNATQNITKSLEKGRLKASTTISCADSKAGIYINDKLMGFSRWDGTLEEGRYVVEARKAGCVTSRVEKTVSGDGKQYINLPAPKEAYGTLTVNSRQDSKIMMRYLDNDKFTIYKINELQNKKLPIGDYAAYSYKTDYKDSETKNFTIEEDKHISIRLPLKSIYTPTQRLERWCFSPIKGSYHSRLFTEITACDGVYGGNIGWVKGRLGVQSSISSSNFSIGPLFRLNLFDKVDTHLYTGVGYDFGFDEVMYEGGFRIADCDLGALNSASLYLGAKYMNGELFPTIGISPLIPIAPIAKDDDVLVDFGMFWGDTGEGDDADGVGFSLSMWHVDYWGWYGSILLCGNCGEVLSYVTGPTLPLFVEYTLTWIYGGIGVVGGRLGFDVGISFATALSIGCQFNDEGAFMTIGFSAPINPEAWD